MRLQVGIINTSAFVTSFSLLLKNNMALFIASVYLSDHLRDLSRSRLLDHASYLCFRVAERPHLQGQTIPCLPQEIYALSWKTSFPAGRSPAVRASDLRSFESDPWLWHSLWWITWAWISLQLLLWPKWIWFLKVILLFTGHLHARNVVLENNVCRLTDIHNTVIGLPGYYRPYLIQLPKICVSLSQRILNCADFAIWYSFCMSMKSKEYFVYIGDFWWQMFPSIDVYCFGRILYEMTFGEGLDAPCIESIPPECPPEIQPVLNLLITTQACFEKGMPTLKYLLSAPYVQNNTKYHSDKVYLL